MSKEEKGVRQRRRNRWQGLVKKTLWKGRWGKGSSGGKTRKSVSAKIKEEGRLGKRKDKREVNWIDKEMKVRVIKREEEGILKRGEESG